MPATENQNLDSEIASLLGRGEDLTLEFKSDLKALSDRDLKLLNRLRDEGKIELRGVRKGAVYERKR